MEKGLQNVLGFSQKGNDGRGEIFHPRTTSYINASAKYLCAAAIIVCCLGIAIKQGGNLFCKSMPKQKHGDRRDQRR